MPRGSKLGWLSVVALVGLGLTLVYLRSSQPTRAAQEPTPTSTSAESAAQLAAVSRELSLVRAELAGLKERVYQPPLSPSVAAASEEPVPDPIPPAPPRPVTLEAAQAHFDQVFAAEAPDVSWARAEEASIGDFVRREAGEGSSIDALSCRSSMCRMQLHFRDDGARDAFKLKLGTPPLNNGGFYKEQGETELVYFAARAGHTLPAVPAE